MKTCDKIYEIHESIIERHGAYVMWFSAVLSIFSAVAAHYTDPSVNPYRDLFHKQEGFSVFVAAMCTIMAVVLTVSLGIPIWPKVKQWLALFCTIAVFVGLVFFLLRFPYRLWFTQ